MSEEEKKNEEEIEPDEDQLREIQDDELANMLDAHEIWFDPDDTGGSPAILSRYNLRNKNFRYKNLQQINFEGADVEGADFTNNNLQGANLTNIKNLNLAEIKGCNFEGAIGLKATDFAGADITGAKLPEDIRDFKILENIEETAKNARKIFAAMLFACGYCWLTIFSTSDVALLTNSSSSPLPIIRTAIPIASFFAVAPFILLGIYVYFHLYLNRLWTGLAGLPAIFDDGRPLYERAYPWLLTGLVRRHFDKLSYTRTKNLKLEELLSIILSWHIVPLTILILILKYPIKGESVLYILLVPLLISVFVGVVFYNIHIVTLGACRFTPSRTTVLSG